MATWEKAIKAYKKGIITLTEANHKIYESITKDNVGAFLTKAPIPLLKSLQKDMKQFPNDEEGWKKFKILHMGAYAGTGWDKVFEEEKQRMRNGVEILRICLEE